MVVKQRYNKTLSNIRNWKCALIQTVKSAVLNLVAQINPVASCVFMRLHFYTDLFFSLNVG